MEKEVITENTMKNKEYKMRQFSALCKHDIIISCKKCFKILCTNSLIEKILRLSNGKICFIIEEDVENNDKYELIEKFISNLFIEKKIYINPNDKDFKSVGIREVKCKKCNNALGVKIKQSDDTQIFMLNKIILKYDSLYLCILDNLGIKPFQFYFKKETIKSMDNEALKIDEYIQKSGNFIQNFFDMLAKQNNELKEMENRKVEIDKLGKVLKYLIDKNYI
jgi:hypothetical protein